MNITIRKATIKDLDKIVNVETNCFPEGQAAPKETNKVKYVKLVNYVKET